jgi:2-keto-4-pentenoate hydratase/2-oxohepta-3-ene-1,7-dioic acid hydratase in catechol pathway
LIDFSDAKGDEIIMVYAELVSGARFEHPITKVVCVGRNYAEHAKELNNPIPTSPILFIKPESSIQCFVPEVRVPRHGIHYEAELAVLIAQPLSKATAAECSAAISALGLGLDLTDRKLQSDLKAKGHPWERAKSFDGACVLTRFIPFNVNSALADFSQLTFFLDINGKRTQTGVCSDMLFDIPSLLSEISHTFSLRPGDVVLTGTPAGVGELEDNAKLRLGVLPFQGLCSEEHTFESSVKVAS